MAPARPRLLASLLLCLARAGAQPLETEAPALHLLVLGAVTHPPPSEVEAAPGRALEADSLAYIRCYPLPPPSFLSERGFGGAYDPAVVSPQALAARADRRVGLHATLPVEQVASSADPQSLLSHSALDVLNAYSLGDWAALGSSDLWCELYDLDRAAAGLTGALGGALLRRDDFAAQSSLADAHTLARNFTAWVDGAGSVHTATLRFRCPLCAFGESGTPDALAAIWAAKGAADAHQALFPKVTQPQLAAQGVQLDKEPDVDDAFFANAVSTPQYEAYVAAIGEAASFWGTHPIPGEGDHSNAARAWLAFAIQASANHAMAWRPPVAPVSGEPSSAHHDAAAVVPPAMLDELQREAQVVIAESFDAAKRMGGNVHVATFAIAGLASGLAARFNVPLRIVHTDEDMAPHINEAIQLLHAKEESRRTAVIVAVTLACVTVGALLCAAAVHAWRVKMGLVAGPTGRKLKRKTSDLPGMPGGHGEATEGAQQRLPGVCEVQLGTPGNTPRTPREGVNSPR